MVRLKEIFSGRPITATGFQFLYGAIKRNHLFATIEGLLEFQFLYGAIKSTYKNLYSPRGTQFQFLYGAIKSITGNTLFVQAPHFNSSMVRLKAEVVQTSFDDGFISIPLWCD